MQIQLQEEAVAKGTTGLEKVRETFEKKLSMKMVKWIGSIWET